MNNLDTNAEITKKTLKDFSNPELQYDVTASLGIEIKPVIKKPKDVSKFFGIQNTENDGCTSDAACEFKHQFLNEPLKEVSREEIEGNWIVMNKELHSLGIELDDLYSNFKKDNLEIATKYFELVTKIEKYKTLYFV